VQTEALKGVRPDGLDQAFFRNDLTRMRGKEHEHLHDLGFQANRTGRSSDAVQRGLDAVGIADEEAVSANRCSVRTIAPRRSRPVPAGTDSNVAQRAAATTEFRAARSADRMLALSSDVNTRRDVP
jgi:hypothetical protein